MSKLERLNQKAAEALSKGDLVEASKLCQEILDQQPNSYYAHAILGLSAMQQGHFETSLKELNLAEAFAESASAKFEIQLNKLDVLRALGQWRDVETIIDSLLPEYPFNTSLLYLKGLSLEEKGQGKKALEYYKQVIAFPGPRTQQSQWIKASSMFSVVTSPFLEPMKTDIDLARELRGSALTRQVEAICYFIEGHAFERMKNFHNARKAFDAGNQIFWQGSSFSCQELLQCIEPLYSIDLAEKKKHVTATSYDKRFVIGLPRSGTSLVESVIAQHKEVTALGETPFMLDAFYNADFTEKNAYHSLESLQCRQQLTKYREYFEQSLSDLNLTTRYWVDKTVNTFFYLGIHLMACPDSRCVYVYKSDLDSALSMYRQHFDLGVHEYSYHPAACILYVKLSKLLMGIWQKQFPRAIYSVAYNELIDHPERTFQSIFKHLGLSWNDNYLNYQQSTHQVRTLSRGQLGESINKKYKNRASNYQGLLEDFKHYNTMDITTLIEAVENSRP